MTFLIGLIGARAVLLIKVVKNTTWPSGLHINKHYLDHDLDLLGHVTSSVM